MPVVIHPDFVIKAKAADGGAYIPLYYDDLAQAVAAFRKVQKTVPTVKLLDNNTGEVLISIENGVTVHEVSFISEIAL